VTKSDRFNQLQPSSRRSDQVFEALREAVINGKIGPGEWLRQDAIAKEMGVSQITVREALSRLVADGMATFEPYRGVYTFTTSLEDLIDIYEMRYELEGLAMELAAARITSEEIETMRNFIRVSVWEEGINDPSRSREANHEFHWVAIRACGRQHLIRILGTIWGLINPYYMFSPSMQRYMSDEMKRLRSQEIEVTHVNLLKALEVNDGKLARKITEDSIADYLTTLRRLIETAEKEKGGVQHER
jgi:DNA-binding GntR family transcriptional regulator